MASYDTARAVIETVERRLKDCSSCGAGWGSGRGGLNPSLPAYDEQDVEDLLTYLRPLRLKETTELEPEVDWAAHSREVMQGFVDLSAERLDLFGLRTPIPLEGMLEFMNEQARRQHREGDVSELEFPTADGPDVVYVYRGFFGDEQRQRIRECSGIGTFMPGQLTPEEHDHTTGARLRLFNGPKRARTPCTGFLSWWRHSAGTLTFRSRRQRDSCSATLTSQSRGSGSVGYQMTGTSPRVHIRLDIYDLHVTSADVQKVYRNLRASLLAGNHGSPLRWRSRLRRQSERTRTLVAFVEQRQGQMKFPTIHEEWQAQFRDRWPDATSRSLYNAYRAAVGRWST